MTSSTVLKPIRTMLKKDLESRPWEEIERELLAEGRWHRIVAYQAVRDDGTPDPERVTLYGEPVEYARPRQAMAAPTA
jgi:hypothetical protein